MDERYLFKGKRADDGTWICGDLISTRGKYYIHPNANSFEVNAYNLAKCVQMIEVIPETVGQCTGLKDKNGKWIFGNDIVKLTDTTHNEELKACITFGNPFNEYNWGWSLMFMGKKRKVDTDILLWVEMEETGVYCEVIGNIYDDNSELLEATR